MDFHLHAPDHLFELGWSISRIIPPGGAGLPWRATAEWAPMRLLRSWCGAPDYLAVGIGRSAAEAAAAALRQAIAGDPRWSLVAEPGWSDGAVTGAAPAPAARSAASPSIPA